MTLSARTEADIVATHRRELKAVKKALAAVMAENARYRADLVALLDWPPLHLDTLRDVIAVGQALELAADSTPARRYGDHARAADQPLPHEPLERERFALEMWSWQLRRCNETAAAHSVIGRQVTPAGPRPKPPARRDEG